MSGACCGSGKGKYSVLILGPAGAGKTTLVKQMRQEKTRAQTTVGLVTNLISIHGYDVLFYDTAGSTELQDHWSIHLGEVEAFIFTIDSTDRRQCPTVSQQLAELLQHPEVKEKPVLIVGTKMDMDGALDEKSLFNVYDLDTVLADNRNAKFAYSELPGKRPVGIGGINVSANNRSAAEERRRLSMFLRRQRMYASKPRQLPAMYCRHANRNSLEQSESIQGEMIVRKPGRDDDENRRVSIVEPRRKEKSEKYQQERDALNEYNLNNSRETEGEDILNLLVQDNFRSPTMTQTFTTGTAYWSSIENYEAGAHQGDDSETMSFKRGTLWLMEAIEVDKREIDNRISIYMNANGSKVRKSFNGLTKIQKVWEKNLRKLGASNTERKSDEDEKGSEDTSGRAYVRATDSAEKMRYHIHENWNRQCKLQAQSTDPFNNRGIRPPLSNGRITNGETVRSKRGISFRETDLSNHLTK